MVSDRALWQAINAHDLDTVDAVLPFSRRLMRETGWTHDFGRRAIHEYKAFIYLVCTAGTMLTPSEEVDQVWHLHLIYTRDYWDRFCGDVLKRRIHHGPTAGGPAEEARHRDAYERTRSLYGAEFGASPPRDLWPDAEIRFQPSKAPAHASDYIHLPKRQVFLCPAGGALALLAGCAQQDAASLWQAHHRVGLVGVAVLWWLLVTLSEHKAIRRKGLTGYILGSAGGVPLFAVLIHFAVQAFTHHALSGLADDLAWMLAIMLGTALWLRSYLSPRGTGGGSGCGSGCSSGSHGGGGHGCGGHGCGSGCGGGH
jgi:hypothetical protein